MRRIVGLAGIVRVIRALDSFPSANFPPFFSFTSTGSHLPLTRISAALCGCLRDNARRSQRSAFTFSDLFASLQLPAPALPGELKGAKTPIESRLDTVIALKRPQQKPN